MCQRAAEFCLRIVSAVLAQKIANERLNIPSTFVKVLAVSAPSWRVLMALMEVSRFKRCLVGLYIFQEFTGVFYVSCHHMNHSAFALYNAFKLEQLALQ